MRWVATAIWLFTVFGLLSALANKSVVPGDSRVISNIWLATSLILWAIHLK